jgi:hypothetical protein
MQELSERASRGVALAALAFACVVVGPTPQVVSAMERVYAVAVQEDQARRDAERDRAPGGDGPQPGQRARRPYPLRP